MPAFQNAVVDIMHTKCVEEWQAPTPQLDFIYSNSLPSSHLRRYCIELIAHSGEAKDLLKNDVQMTLFTREAARDILRLVWGTGLKRKTKQELKAWDLCQYHVHEEGVRCRK